MPKEKKMRTLLTIEESAKLVELGVDPNLAKGESLVGGALFTLADLLSVLPKEIVIDGVRASLQMYQHLAGYWIASYVRYDGNKITHQRPLSADKELIIALNQLLIWCLDQGFVNTKDVKK